MSDEPNDLMWAGDGPWDLLSVVLDDGGDDYYSHDNAGCLGDFEESPFLPPAPDADSDGIPDALDLDPGRASDDFADGLGTFGTMLDRAGLTIAVSELPDPRGVRIAVGPGTGQAQVRVCDIATAFLDPGEEITIACGSVTATVVRGPVDFDLDNGSSVTTPQGTTATADQQPDGSYTIRNDGPGQISVQTNGATTLVPVGQTITTPAPDPCAGPPPAGAIVGTAGNNKLTGTNGNDVIFGLAGNDTIDAGKGNDLICAGNGNDTAKGGDGDDRLDLGANDDKAEGNAGDDTLTERTGAATLNGDDGNDTLNGGDGRRQGRRQRGQRHPRRRGGTDNILNGGVGNDTLDGGPGIDKLSGDAGTDTCTGETRKNCEA